MVRFTADHKIYIKILYWGMAGSGKTTIVDTLYRLTKEQKKDIEPVGNLTKIAMASGATLYFDRGIFQSLNQRKIYYHVYTVAGQSRFSPLRKKIFKGTDGVIFVVDSQTHFFEDNIESLKELKNITRDKLIKEIPLIIMLNKQDLTNVINEEDFKQILTEEKLWLKPGDDFYNWNPIIYKTCALYDKRKDVYNSYSECVRRISLYQKDLFRGDDDSSFPYNFKHPPPPGDTAMY
ncbi:MAG: ADP-ribosylation factor-like protein [Promethearchaeota archaeon]